MLDLAGLAPVPAPTTTRVGSRLLASASELFYNRGITAVGVDMLADHAGTTKRTLYQRFGSKDGLIAAYLQQRAHTWQATLLTALGDAAPSTPSGGLAVVFSTAEQWARGNPRGCAFVNAWAELNSIQSSGVEIIAAEKRWMLDLLGRILGRSDTAAQVHLIYEGAHVTASILGDRDAYKRAETTSRRLLDRTIDMSSTGSRLPATGEALLQDLRDPVGAMHPGADQRPGQARSSPRRPSAAARNSGSVKEARSA